MERAVIADGARTPFGRLGGELAEHQSFELAGPAIKKLVEDVDPVDEPPRRDTSLEKLSRLKTVYGSPTVTAGNAPGLNDGAALTLVVSEAIRPTPSFSRSPSP
jgi:acetyl-CoA acetyltransferase